MFKYINLKSNILVIAIIIAIFGVSFLPQKTYAIPNSVLNYQGRLTNSSGSIVADGTYNITFSIYTDSATSGSSWSETQSVPVRNGIFSVVLGNINSINLDFNASSYYLGIKVGSDSEMTPRTQIGAAPFAINSKKLNGMDAGTEANNILQLNASGEIEIDGAIRGSGGLYITDGSIELPQGSIDGSYISNNAIDAAKLNISAINSDGKLKALSSDYLADLNGSNLTGVNASSIADGIVTNAKVSATASIAYSKLNLANAIQGTDIVSGAIDNDKVSATASIAYSKLNLATSIQGSDLASNISINTSGALTVSGTFNTTGTFQINSAQLNATATEINNLSGYTGNTNDLNILSGGALAGVTSTEFQYLNGVTSAIQGQLDARLQLAGGTMAGAIAMAGNNITNTGTLSFNAVTDTVAGIQNQNLVDKSAVEVISGAWTFSDDITIANGQWVGLGTTDPRISFSSTGAGSISIEDAQYFNVGQINASDNIVMSNNKTIGIGGIGGADIFFNEDTTPDSLIFRNALIETQNSYIKGDSYWSGRETGTWSNADPSTITVSVGNLSVHDLVVITPVTEKVGNGDYWITAGADSFTVSSRNSGGAFQETMDFNWIIIRQ